MESSTHQQTFRWNVVFHYASFALGLTQAFLLLPYYLRKVGGEAFGYWIATGAIINWLAVVELGVSSVIQQRAGSAYGRRSSSELRELASHAFVVAGALTLGVSLLVLCARPWLSSVVSVGEVSVLRGVEVAFVLAGLGMALSVGSTPVAGFNYGTQASVGPGLINVGSQGLGVLIAVLGVAHGYGIVALGTAGFVRGLVSMLSSALLLLYRSGWTLVSPLPGIGSLREVLRLSFTTGVGRLCYQLCSSLDLIVVTRTGDPSLVTSYALTQRGVQFARVVVERPSLAASPVFSFLEAKRQDAEMAALAMQILNFAIWFGGGICFGFASLNSGFINLWVGPEQYLGGTANILFCISAGLSMLATSLVNLLAGTSDLSSAARLQLLAAAIGAAAIIWAGLAAGTELVAAASCVPPGVLLIGLVSRFRAQGILTSKEVRSLVREVVLVGLAGTAVLVVAPNTHPSTWSSFAGMLLVCVGSYGVVLLVASALFRAQVASWIRSIANR